MAISRKETRRRTAKRREKKLTACAAEILLRRNLAIWNAAIYCMLVLRDIVMVCCAVR
jgi:hypothetical protein